MGLDADWISRVWSLGGNVQSPAGGLFLFDNEDGTYDIVRRRISGEDLDDETVERGLTEEQAARRYYEGALPRSNGGSYRKLLRSLQTRARDNAPPPNPFRGSDRERQLVSLHMLAVQINELQVRNQQDYTQEVADLLEELEALHNQIVQQLGLDETQHEMHYQVYDEHYDIGAWLSWGRALLYDKGNIRGNGRR
jgi:hypothetical protein